MISIHIRIIGLYYYWGVLKSSDRALLKSMQQQIYKCNMKGYFQCPSWCVFHFNEKISRKIHQQNLWKYFFVFFSSIIQIPHPFGKGSTWLWYIQFPAHTSSTFRKIKRRILKVFPGLDLLAHICKHNEETTSVIIEQTHNTSSYLSPS